MSASPIRAMFAALAVSWGLSGCLAVGPDYVRPEFQAPQAWSGAGGQAGQDAASAEGLATVAWWEKFGDPVLNDLIRQAVAGNLDLEQARARVAQARAGVGTATAALLPGLNLNGSVTRTYNGVDTRSSSSSQGGSGGQGGTQVSSSRADDVVSSTFYQAGFDSSWELDVFGGLRRNREQAAAKLEASQEELRAVRLTLIGDVARQYVTLRSSQHLLAIAREAARTQADNLELTRTRCQAGLTSHLDVAQAQTLLATTTAECSTLETAARQAAHRVCVLLGRAPGTLPELLANPGALPQAGALLAMGLPAQLLERRPDLRKAERTLAAASAAIGVATADLYPKFDLTLGLGLQSSNFASFSALTPWYASIIPSLAMPLFDAGKTRAAIAGKQAAFEESRAAYQAAFLTALEDVENALAAYYGERARQEELAKAVASGEDALNLARERYRRGLTTFLDVLDAEKSLLSSRSALNTSSANILLNMIALYKALGGGWDAPDANG